MWIFHSNMTKAKQHPPLQSAKAPSTLRPRPLRSGTTTAKPIARPSQAATAAKRKPSTAAPSSDERRRNVQAKPKPHAPTRNLNSKTPIARKKASVQPSSLVHDAIRRAFHSSATNDVQRTAVPRTTDYAAECERLREDLERVMADHQRQADEIVALRALARSMKEEVEMMQEAVREQDSADSWMQQQSTTGSRRAANHEFFQLDLQIDTLRVENEQLKERVEVVEREKAELQDIVENEMPRFELLAVQARAELESVESQLVEEQTENDRLRSEVAYYKARSRSPVRTEVGSRERHTRRGDVRNSQDNSDDDKENGKRLNRDVDADDTLRESLMSSVASLSMSAASVFSTQLQDDLETLKAELRRLHRSIDASVVKEDARTLARCSNGARHHQESAEHKDED